MGARWVGAPQKDEAGVHHVFRVAAIRAADRDAYPLGARGRADRALELTSPHAGPEPHLRRDTLHGAQRAGVAVGKDRFRAVLRDQRPPPPGDLVQRLLPRDGFEPSLTLGTYPAHGTSQPLRVQDELQVVVYLCAQPAARVGVVPVALDLDGHPVPEGDDPVVTRARKQPGATDVSDAQDARCPGRLERRFARRCHPGPDASIERTAEEPAAVDGVRQRTDPVPRTCQRSDVAPVLQPPAFVPIPELAWLFLVLVLVASGLLGLEWLRGWSMIALAALVHLPVWAVTAFVVGLIAVHNLVDPIPPASFGALAPLWKILHTQGLVVNRPDSVVFVAYPLIPWIGVTAAGYAFGQVFSWPSEQRRRFLVRCGVALTVTFVAASSAASARVRPTAPCFAAT